MSHSNFDIDEAELAGLSEDQLQELSEFIDPDNELLPASDRLPAQTTKKPTGPFSRQHLKDHLKKVAAESTIGEDYVPFVKKPSPKDSQPSHKPAPKAVIKTEFDDMLEMLEGEDLAELASELGLHGLLDQAQSRGDEPASASPGTGLHKPGSFYSYQTAPPELTSDEPPQDTDIEEAIASLQSDDPYLRELNLNNHSLIDSDLIFQLIDAMEDNTCLLKLSMSNVKFSEDHAKALAEKVLRTNCTLTVLNLESNRITPKGIKALMKAIAENKDTSLKELRLVNQYFPGGARAESDIAKFLEKNTTIVKLGYVFSVPSYRNKADQYIMRNTDFARKKRASITV